MTVLYAREAELERLSTTALESAQAKSPRVVIVEGVSGQGKTALVRTFLDDLQKQDEPPLIVEARAFSENEVGLSYRLIGNALTSIVASPSKGLSWTRRLIDGAMEVAPELIGAVIPGASLIAAAIGVGMGDRKVSQFISSRSERLSDLQIGQTASQVKALLTYVSEGSPVVLFLDDIQWADSGSLMVLQHLLGEPDFPLMVVATARTMGDVGTSLPFKVSRTELLRRFQGSLIDLDTQDDTEFCGEYLHRSFETIPSEWVSALEDVTGGNPFFVSTIVRELQSDDSHGGDLSNLDPVATLSRYGSVLSDFVETIVTSQPADSRQVLEAGATFGFSFPAQLLSGEFPELDEVAIMRLCDSLQVDDGILRDAGQQGYDSLDWYRFDHHLLYDAARRRVGKGLARARAKKFLDGLAAFGPPSGAEQVSIVSDLLERSGQAQEAAELLYGLAKEQDRTSDFAGALATITRAMTMVDQNTQLGMSCAVLHVALSAEKDPNLSLIHI